MKIQIIGYSGAGKSTLADILKDYYHIPYLYMDSTKFYDDMQEREPQEQAKIVYDFLAANDEWVIDGNYYTVAPERYDLCDEIYFLDYPRLFCLKEAIKRYFKNRHQFRESLGCVESFDFSFLIWILYEGRTKYWRNKHLEHLRKAKVGHHFKKRQELIRYLKEKGIV